MGYFLHALVGGLLMASAVFGGPWGLVGGLTLYGIGREMAQHDIRLTMHQWAEALSWGVGPLCVLLGAYKWY